MQFSRSLVFICSFLLLTACSALAEQAVHIAVFDPQVGTIQSRFTIDLKAHDRIAQQLHDAGFHVNRLTADDIASPGKLSADVYDAIVFHGIAFPRADLAALQSFSDHGGVLISINPGVPFLIAIEKAPDGLWQMSPMEPKWAWQTTDLMQHIGIHQIYDVKMHNTGKRETVTPLLRRYMPDAATPPQQLPHMWLIPATVGKDKGKFYPLIRSQRTDGIDVTPQVFISRIGRRYGIVSLNEAFDPMIPALARIAHDLKSGQLKPTDDMAVDIPQTLPPPKPLRSRLAIGEVNPENAKPVIRWGRFDGSSVDLDEGPLPPELAPGRSVTLSLPDAPSADKGPVYLRVRFSYDQSYAGLRADIGGVTVLNQCFLFGDTAGESNHITGSYDGVPAEAVKIVFVPSWGKTLTLSNPGSQPIYLDAMQLEQRQLPGAVRWTGEGAGGAVSYPGGSSGLKSDTTRRWSILRCGPRTQFVGEPDDPHRWDACKQIMDRYVALSDRFDLIFEGTPHWAAVSEQRYEEGVKARRPHVVPPDPRKYEQIAEWIIDHYNDYVKVYEIWNETDIQQFWRGTTDEYLDFAAKMMELIHRKAPGKPVILSGMAHTSDEYIRKVCESEAGRLADMVALHPYISQSAMWDVPYGKLQGQLYAMGNAKEIYCNESGFVWTNSEWFTNGWTPQRQRDAMNVAMARLLDGDIAKLSMFNGGGDSGTYGIYDQNGNPRPAAAVVEDYVSISDPAMPGARRLDVSMTPADGDVALTGVYIAGSVGDDGAIAMIVNPCQSPLHSRSVRVTMPLSKRAAWQAEAHDETGPMDVKLQAGENAASVTLTVTHRTIIRLTPR